jgi:cell division protein FtsB
MNGEIEAVENALTNVEATPAVETVVDEAVQTIEPAACLNCGAQLSGPYCAACGQAAHLHRSLSSLAHDILHGVFHFEGKIWRTLPELLFHPGRLTRRYIDGERTKFVSPMALYLFTVFLIFAIFAFVGAVHTTTGPGTTEWVAQNEAAIAEADDEIARLREQLADPATTAEQRAQIEEEIEELQSGREAAQALAAADWGRLVKLGKSSDSDTSSWQPTPGGRLDRAIQHVKANPDLLSYKIKTSAYKFSWALIPLSVPFLWLLFFWRRDIHLYDHAVFTTYSITFMMLFALLLWLAGTIGLPEWITATAFFVVPPLHLYKQLRGAYGLSRPGALLRLAVLFVFILIVIVLFFSLLVAMGLWG